MNKKIFTLLVGACMLIGSLFTVNAQRRKPYVDMDKTQYPTTAGRFQTAHFNDILTADTVKKLPGTDGYYYLLSVTGLANPETDAVSQQLFNTLGKSPNGPVSPIHSVDTSIVLYVDNDGTTAGTLRLEHLAILDSAIYNLGAMSKKFDAIRRASWCLSYTQSSVAGSNVTFDFQNLRTGRFLEAPLLSELDHADWNISSSHSYANAMYNKAIDQFDDNMIVSGWHFSQSYLPTQNLQTGMPLYSYVKTDTVAVLVLNPVAYEDPAGGNTGGYTVSVKHVAVKDLVKDATGNVRLNPDPKAISNVLLFTVKKLNKFVMNADDWNAVNEQLEFNPNATEFVINGNRKGEPDYPGDLNPFTERKLTAAEVNDSLFHYGYMQFSRPVTGTEKSYLFVDTAFGNFGNDTYLAFNWSDRRDSTQYGDNAGSFLWGDSFNPAITYAPGMTKKPDSVYYQQITGLWNSTVYWRLDSLIWAMVKEAAAENSLSVNDFVDNITGDIVNQQATAYNYTISASTATAWNEIVQEAALLATRRGITHTPLSTITAGLVTGFFPPSSTPTLGGTWSNTEHYIPANYAANYAFPISARAQYLSDSVSYLLSYMKDSLMENQSKFRVVYDPFADSTYINVYQTRVRYPDLTNSSVGIITWPDWWENSFMLKSAHGVHDFSGRYGGGAYIRPSDAYTDTYVGNPSLSLPTVPVSMTTAASNYYTVVITRIPFYGTTSIRRSDASGLNVLTPLDNLEQHGNLDVLTDNGGYNFHSLMVPHAKSTISPMDKVMISTADTCAIYERFYAYGNNAALAHIYGWSLNNNGQPMYRDSLFYVDIQSLDGNSKRILTLDQSYRAGGKALDTQIKINFGPKCKTDPSLEKATIENDLYLIRNSLGEYLSVPITSLADSVEWSTPREGEDPTRIPAFQWAIINVRENTKNSPFRMINREFEKVEFPYTYVYENKLAPFQFAPASVHIKPKFNNKNVYGKSTEKKDAIGKAPVNAENFVNEMEGLIPLNSGISFIRLNKEVKEDQLLGYKYIDRDSTVVDVYAMKYLHGLGGAYLSWRGYDYDPKDPTSVKDTCIYVEGDDYYSKLFFELQEMTNTELYDYEPKYKQGKVVLTAENVKDKNADFADLYKKFASKERRYTNADSIVLERFGFYEAGKIENLKPLARQAYRLFLKDYYRWHPTLKGHYVTVGQYDRYILADRAYAAKTYVKASDRLEGLFGIPHFYFRNVYFDVDYESGNDYFALVQRLDTLRTDLPEYDFQHPLPTAGVYDDLYEWLVKRFNTEMADRILPEIAKNQEFQPIMAFVGDHPWRLEMAIRGESGIRLSTFQLEQDNDPIYRRFHVNEPNEKFGDELWNTDLPDTLQFHLHNEPDAGRRLYENSGGYRSNDKTAEGPCGGRPYNVDANGNYKVDSLGQVISYLGINYSTEYPNTNYAFYLDTAYVNRGTGWLKPQYMLVVDPYKPLEGGDCDPGTGEIVPVNQNFVIGRYLFNSAMYAKEVRDSLLNANYIWEYTDKYYDASKSDGIEYAENKFASGYRFKSDNYSKVQPVKDVAAGLMKNSPYLTDRQWERLAFAWAIHKGDSLYVLKNLEPMFDGKDNDPVLVWKKLVEQYGVSSSANGDYVDFDRLIEENTATTFDEAYYPYGNGGTFAEMRKYRTFKSVSGTDKIGLHAIIDLGDNTHKDWVFSMRYIERNSSDFVIESETTDRDTRNGAVIRPGYGGWVKFQNHVPVITRSDEHEIMADSYGAVFNVKRLHQDPVSNEDVNASNTEVTVIGGTGTVTILNASGKNVVISNMLGQTVANTKLNSDNASISVPAGIVVVSVEGDKTSKVLVK